MKILVAPDKFKDALAAPAVAEMIAAGVHDVLPDAEVARCPLADGGDGSGAIIAAALNATPQRMPVNDPLGRPIQALWWRQKDTRTAIVEMAQASGSQLLDESERSAARSTSFGTGELIRAAIGAGCDRVILCVGGSASVDGGAGCLQALGWTLLDGRGVIIPTLACGASLSRVERIVPPDAALGATVDILCDVDNPLCGRRGAAEAFAEQKGATPREMGQLSTALKRWAAALRALAGRDLSSVPFSGAAGGIAAGLSAACGARLTSGFDSIAAMVDLPRKLRGCDLCLSGEGRIDVQTARGKTVAGVARLAQEASVPTIALVGQAKVKPAQTLASLAADIGLCDIRVITPAQFELERALRDTPELLRRAAAAVSQDWSDSRGPRAPDGSAPQS